LRISPGAAAPGGRRGFCPHEDAERELAAATRMGVAFLALGRGRISRLGLRPSTTAPPLLAVRGQAAVLKEPMIAMVGSRNASGAGIKLAEQLRARPWGCRPRGGVRACPWH